MSPKTSSSRFADGYQSVTSSPSLIFSPRISVSFVTWRSKCMTGDAHRTISSIASGMTSGFSTQLRDWSGLFISASIPCDAAFRVVSLPAMISSRNIRKISPLLSFVPSTSVLTRTVRTSSRGLVCRSSIMSPMYWKSSIDACISSAVICVSSIANSGSSKPSARLVSSNIVSQSPSGTPTISQITSSGSLREMSMTKSHSPCSMTSSMISVQRLRR